VPELHFVYDTTEDRARTIDEILDSLEIPEAEEGTEDRGN
jgi:ribosome-binding factor A